MTTRYRGSAGASTSGRGGDGGVSPWSTAAAGGAGEDEEEYAEPPHFPLSSQPDIVRATQKDELYLAHVTEVCSDLVQRVLGSRASIHFQREVRLLSATLYYGLTTGTGQQTLGEEYTDIIQVGPEGLAPESWRRAALVALKVLVPYAAGRAGRAAEAAAAAAEPAAREEEEPAPAATAAVAGMGWQRRAAEHLRPWLPWLVPVTKEGLFWAAQVHLALFYLYGLYFEWPKRLVRVRHIFIAPEVFTRPSYHALGVVLVGKLGLQAAIALWGRVMAATHRRAPDEALERVLGQEGARAVAAGGGWGGAVVLDEAGSPANTSSAAAAARPGGAAGGGGKCPLCLSARDHPAATQCGHVFCWSCIAEWCREKPECPLCRAPTTASNLVALVHCDL